MKDNTDQAELSVQGQRDYEEWKAELLSDPDDRAVYEQGVQQILRQQEQVTERESSSAKRVTSSQSSSGVRPVFRMGMKKRD